MYCSRQTRIVTFIVMVPCRQMSILFYIHIFGQFLLVVPCLAQLCFQKTVGYARNMHEARTATDIHSNPTDLMCFIPLPRNSQEEVIFERQLVRFSTDLQIPITRESSAEDIEFISSYLTFIKFARIFLPEPGSCLSSLMYKSGAHTSLTFHVLYFIS